MTLEDQIKTWFEEREGQNNPNYTCNMNKVHDIIRVYNGHKRECWVSTSSSLFGGLKNFRHDLKDLAKILNHGEDPQPWESKIDSRNVEYICWTHGKSQYHEFILQRLSSGYSISYSRLPYSGQSIETNLAETQTNILELGSAIGILQSMHKRLQVLEKKMLT